MTPDEAVRALDEIDARDPESAHGLADQVLLLIAPPQVAEAYLRLVERSSWWAAA